PGRAARACPRGGASRALRSWPHRCDASVTSGSIRLNGPLVACYFQRTTMRPPRSGGSLRSWAVPSLMVGAVATLVDVGVLLASIRWLRASTAEGAMLGVAVGSTRALPADRRFAFRRSAAAARPGGARVVRRAPA